MRIQLCCKPRIKQYHTIIHTLRAGVALLSSVHMKVSTVQRHVILLARTYAYTVLLSCILLERDLPAVWFCSYVTIILHEVTNKCFDFEYPYAYAPICVYAHEVQTCKAQVCKTWICCSMTIIHGK